MKKNTSKINKQSRRFIVRYSVFPPSVVNVILETGQAPAPTAHICSILFTDVVNFTVLSSLATPSGIATMLDDMVRIIKTVLFCFFYGS